MKKVFSGIQPSGVIHLGNYLGAIKQWVKLQDEVDQAVFCVVDLHAITVPQDPAELKKNILSVAALYLAAGIDPEKSIVFVQSTRPEHTELAWILNTITKMGELSRMTQFKEKTHVEEKKIEREHLIKLYNILVSKGKTLKEIESFLSDKDFVNALAEYIVTVRQTAHESFGVGLFDYPVLMAADILLYGTTDVPVGDDQKQHVELARDLAIRFNSKYGATFTVPEPLIRRESARIMGLDDPAKKMSKSALSALNYIAILDDAATISNKIKRAVTDSESEIKAGAEKPAITNLLNIFAEVSGKNVAEIEHEFQDKNYGQFKEALADAVVSYLKPIQERYDKIIQDEDHLRKILEDGSERARVIAGKTLADAKEKVGLGL